MKIELRKIGQKDSEDDQDFADVLVELARRAFGRDWVNVPLLEEQFIDGLSPRG